MNNVENVSTEITVPFLTAYSGSFATKDGKEISYYRMVIKSNRGVKELSITAGLYDEVKDYAAGDISVKFVYDFEHEKARLDVL